MIFEIVDKLLFLNYQKSDSLEKTVKIKTIIFFIVFYSIFIGFSIKTTNIC